MRCGNDPRNRLTDEDRAVLARFRNWLIWSALPEDEKAVTPDPSKVDPAPAAETEQP